MTATTSGLVPALVASSGEYPDERVEIVFEIAAELRQADDHEAALDWLGTVVASGGFDASLARLQAAEIHFDAGRSDLAMAALRALEDSRERDPEAYAFAGEMLDERGDEQGALRWFTMGASRLREQEIADARGEFGWMSPHYGILWQRHLLRERLGYPPDGLQQDLWGSQAAYPSVICGWRASADASARWAVLALGDAGSSSLCRPAAPNCR